MINEELFDEFLVNRTKLSSKGKKINTPRAVKAQRKRLNDYELEGYDPTFLLNHALDNSWLQIFRVGEPKQHHATAGPGMAPMIANIVQKHRAPQSNRNPQQHADKVRLDGRKALDELLRMTAK